MAFKLTYSDGQESQHDDDTVWEIDDGVLKLGRKKDEWSVYLSPSHWAVLELGGGASKGDDEKTEDKDESESESESKDGTDKKERADEDNDEDEDDKKDD